MEPDLDDAGAGESAVDGHAMDLVQVLRAARNMGGRLGHILLMGCEPADLGGAEGRMG